MFSTSLMTAMSVVLCQTQEKLHTDTHLAIQSISSFFSNLFVCFMQLLNISSFVRQRKISSHPVTVTLLNSEPQIASLHQHQLHKSVEHSKVIQCVLQAQHDKPSWTMCKRWALSTDSFLIFFHMLTRAHTMSLGLWVHVLICLGDQFLSQKLFLGSKHLNNMTFPWQWSHCMSHLVTVLLWNHC